MCVDNIKHIHFVTCLPSVHPYLFDENIFVIKTIIN